MITHEEANDLLAVYALDAVGEDEQALIEEHLATCPRCRAELDAHREVAAALGNSVEPLPEGLWSGISSRLPRPEEEPPPMPMLVGDDEGIGDGLGHRKPEVPSVKFRAPRPAGSRRRSGGRGRLVSLASIAVAAAAVAAVLGVNLVRDDHRISNLQNTSAVQAALDTQGHKIVTADGPDHAVLAKFVTLPSGQGYLIKANLPKLSSKQTYQLWGVVDGQSISLGLLGSSPHSGSFTLAGSAKPSKLGITVEPAGGTVVPTTAMVAIATV